MVKRAKFLPTDARTAVGLGDIFDGAYLIALRGLREGNFPILNNQNRMYIILEFPNMYARYRPIVARGGNGDDIVNQTCGG